MGWTDPGPYEESGGGEADCRPSAKNNPLRLVHGARSKRPVGRLIQTSGMSAPRLKTAIQPLFGFAPTHLHSYDSIFIAATR